MQKDEVRPPHFGKSSFRYLQWMLVAEEVKSPEDLFWYRDEPPEVKRKIYDHRAGRAVGRKIHH